jgi:hypothetical protein
MRSMADFNAIVDQKTFNSELYQKRLATFSAMWSERRKRYIYCCIAGLVAFFIAMFVIYLLWGLTPALVVSLIIGGFGIGFVCIVAGTNGFYWASSFRGASDKAADSVKSYYTALFAPASLKNKKFDTIQSYMCSIDSIMNDGPDIEAFSAGQTNDRQSVSQELAQCVPSSIGTLGQDYALEYSVREPVLIEKSESIQEFKVPIDVRCMSNVKEGGIIVLKVRYAMQFFEQKQLVNVWGKWFIVNSQFKISV